MRLTILGSSASYADAGRACAGYLVESGGVRVLLDCGNGTVANLSSVTDPTTLDAVFITHGHIDHFADIYALQAALRYAPEGPAPPLDLYVPPGLFETMGCVLTERGRQELIEAFRVHALARDGSVAVGDVTIEATLVDHLQPTFALAVVSDGARLAYTSDTRLGDAVRAFARGADVLLADATLPEPYAGRADHMTPREAGELAADAQVATLVLTHLWPSVDREQARREASECFEGRIIVASELESIDVVRERLHAAE